MYFLDTNICSYFLKETSEYHGQVAFRMGTHEKGTLVTHNSDEFKRVIGLKIEDWTQE
jgi:predicted nucleic acid-binding protein